MNEQQNINQLPKDWKWVKLGEACEIVSGNSPKGLELISNKGQYQFYKVSDMNLGGNEIKMNVSNLKLTLEEIKKLKVKVYPKGTVIFPKKGGAILTNKKRVLSQDASFDLNLMGILPNDKPSSNYLFYWIKKLDLSNIYDGSNVPQINNKNVAPLDFPFPPKPTQQAIVSKIEELFSELDKGIENLRTAQQQLKSYRQSVLKWAFEGKQTEEWKMQKKHLISGEELIKKIKKEKEMIANFNKKKVKSFAEIDEDELEELFAIPKEWKWARNEEYLFEVKDSTHDTPKYLPEGIPFVTQKNIRVDGLDFSDMQFISEAGHNKFYLRSNVAKGDVIISMIGLNRGMTAIVELRKYSCIKNVGLFKFLPHLQSNKFSFYYYQSRIGLNIVLRKSKGGAQPFIGLTELRNWPVVVCSFEEQNEIVQEIESRLTVADKMEESITQSLQKAEALRQSILKKAFEGRLVC